MFDAPHLAKGDWRYIVVSICITLALLAVAVFFTFKEISIPLNTLEASLKAMSELDFSVPPPSSRMKEINCISQTFKKLRTGTFCEL